MPMSFGYVDAPSEDDPARVIHRALELGVAMLDTADVYGPFSNEELVGRALEGRRDDATIATKVGLVVGATGGYPLRRDARPERIAEAIQGSLRRLRTDVVDLYYLHRVDEHVPLEESWGRDGLARRGGPRAGARALGGRHRSSSIARTRSIRWRRCNPSSACGPATRSPRSCPGARHTVPPSSRSHRSVAASSPARSTGRGFDERDFRASNPRFTDEAIAANQAIVDVVRSVAARHAATPAQVALAWTLAQGEHVVPIPGTKRTRYLEENMAAAEADAHG